MTWLDLFALSLAGGSLVDCWLNGSIFAGWRQRLSGWTLLSCDYCLNWQTPIWLVLLFYVPSFWLPPPWNVVVKLPIYALAASYAAWLINEFRARYDCDYRRTVTATEMAQAYGGTGPESPAESKAASGPTLPALIHHDRIRYFCTHGCRGRYLAIMPEDDSCSEFEQPIDDLGPVQFCAACGRPLTSLLTSSAPHERFSAGSTTD